MFVSENMYMYRSHIYEYAAGFQSDNTAGCIGGVTINQSIVLLVLVRVLKKKGIIALVCIYTWIAEKLSINY